jgi:RNA polymerase subunit RPABC4/transcription elongation factor Spt4
MIFKRKMRTCFKCEKEFPDSYEMCPMCYPAEFELNFGNVAVMIGIIFLILLFLAKF